MDPGGPTVSLSASQIHSELPINSSSMTKQRPQQFNTRASPLYQNTTKLLGIQNFSIDKLLSTYRSVSAASSSYRTTIPISNAGALAAIPVSKVVSGLAPSHSESAITSTTLCEEFSPESDPSNQNKQRAELEHAIGIPSENAATSTNLITDPNRPEKPEALPNLVEPTTSDPDCLSTLKSPEARLAHQPQPPTQPSPSPANPEQTAPGPAELPEPPSVLPSIPKNTISSLSSLLPNRLLPQSFGHGLPDGRDSSHQHKEPALHPSVASRLLRGYAAGKNNNDNNLRGSKGSMRLALVFEDAQLDIRVNRGTDEDDHVANLDANNPGTHVGEHDQQADGRKLTLNSKFLRKYISAQRAHKNNAISNLNGRVKHKAQKEIDSSDKTPADASNPNARTSFPKIQLDASLEATGESLILESTRVVFPFHPYEEQRQYMKHLIATLDKSHNGLFESPTGTGKTLSLLTASLAWLAREHSEDRNKETKIFYASRTHSQLKQLVGELKTTAYRPLVCLLASRDQLCVPFPPPTFVGGIGPLCVHKGLAKIEGPEKNSKCFQMIATDTCGFYRGTKKSKETLLATHGHKILDIEDMCKLGELETFCPFYFSRSMIKDAHLIFLPYVYLTNPEYRDLIKQYLPKSIILIDEAHNISSAAEEGASFKYTCRELEGLSEDITKIKDSLVRQSAGDYRAVSLQNKLEGLRRPILTLKSLISGQFQKSLGHTVSMEPEMVFQFVHDAVTMQKVEQLDNSIPPRLSGIDWRKETLLHINDSLELLDYLHTTKHKRFDNLSMNGLLKWANTLIRVCELYSNFKTWTDKPSGWKHQAINHYCLFIEDKNNCCDWV